MIDVMSQVGSQRCTWPTAPIGVVGFFFILDIGEIFTPRLYGSCMVLSYSPIFYILDIGVKISPRLYGKAYKILLRNSEMQKVQKKNNVNDENTELSNMHCHYKKQSAIARGNKHFS